MTRKTKIATLLVASVAGFFMYALFFFGVFGGMERILEDTLFSEKPIHPDIVIVAIDNESIARVGQWPWPRKVFADFLSKLQNVSPKSVGIDILFSEQSRFGKTDDAALKTALGNVSYPIVLAGEAEEVLITESGAEAHSFLTPLAEFSGNPKVSLGYVNVIEDRDGVVRSVPLSIRGEKSTSDAFALNLLKQSGRKFPLDSFGPTTRIVYAASPNLIDRIPFWKIISGDAADALQGKIVLVGVTAPDLHDDKATPVSKGLRMPGVELHANILNMLLQGYRLASPSLFSSFFLIFLAALVPAFSFQIFWKRLFAFLAIVLWVGAVLIFIIIMFDRGIIFSILHTFLSTVVSGGSVFGYLFFIGERERRELEHIFSKYVSRDVLDEILKNPAAVSLGGEEREITILFSDIRGFTTLSEKMAPQELVSILNRYFSAMTDEILKTGGVVDKYIGDAIMAFWGAPVSDPKQANHAVQAALGMVLRLKNLNEELRRIGDPEIKIGIGIYTGRAVVGNIGSDLRFDYTAIGDTVNAASRIEGLNKEYGAEIIIGESTKENLDKKYQCTFLGSAEVKGRKEPIRIYSVQIKNI